MSSRRHKHAAKEEKKSGDTRGVMGFNASTFGQLLPRDAILRRHAQKVQRIREVARERGVQMFWSRAPPAHKSAAVALGMCSPIHIADLVVGTTHARRSLFGRIVVQPCLDSSVQSVLEDSRGDVVMLAVYNAPEDWHQAGGRLCEGASIVIREPFYKVAADGTLMVRVDNPLDIEVAPAGASVSGNALFAAGEWDSAVRCYGDDLGRHPSLTLLQACATNCALADKANPTLSMCWASLAVCLGPSDKGQRLLTDAVRSLLHLDMRHDVTPRDISAALASPEAWTNLTQTLEAVGSDEPRAVTAAALKEEGNTSFRQGDARKAIMLWLGAAQMCADTAATLLINRAACNLQRGLYNDVLLDIVAGLVLRPPAQLRVKAHYRGATALLCLNHVQAAEVQCREGLRVDPSSKAVSALANRISQALEAGRWTASFLASASVRERVEDSRSAIDHAERSEQQNMSRASQQAMNDKLQQIGMVRSDVPPFHEEMSQSGQWPLQCVLTECVERMGQAYEMARSQIYERGLFFTDTGSAFGFDEMEHAMFKSMLPKRLHAVTPRDFERNLSWWQEASIGSVQRDRPRHPYSPLIIQNFSNAVNRREMLTRGTSHVSIGFVDLGVLRSSVLQGPAERGPLRWYGYEASAFCVAKTLVVVAMMRLPTTGIAEIIQVWYSATWTTATHTAFRQALTVVIASALRERKQGATQWSVSDEVLVYLVQWQTREVSVPEARKGWGARYNAAKVSYAGTLVRRSDRLAFLRYALCGDVLEGGKHGSLTMFAQPPQLGLVQPEAETFFNTLDFNRLATRWSRDRNLDIVSVATQLLVEEVGALTAAVRSGDIDVVSIRHATVSPDASELLTEIASLQPWTMSWSNVLDYVGNFATFHRVARSVSGNDTIHFAYSMNWIADTKGASCLDVPREGRQVYLEASLHGLADLVNHWGVAELIRMPHVGNPVNIADSGAAIHVYRNWTSAFFSAGNVPPQQVGNIELSAFNPFATNAPIVLFTWTYSPSVTFQAARN